MFADVSSVLTALQSWDRIAIAVAGSTLKAKEMLSCSICLPSAAAFLVSFIILGHESLTKKVSIVAVFAKCF